MKALSVRQPFAFQIAEGAKTIELRSRPTKHRGLLLICSSKSGADWWYEDEDGAWRLPKGTHVAVVNIIDCRPATKDDAEAAWCDPEDIDEGMWAWVIEPETSEPVKPTPVIGRLGLFEVDDTSIDHGDDDVYVTDYYEQGHPPDGAYVWSVI